MRRLAFDRRHFHTIIISVYELAAQTLIFIFLYRSGKSSKLEFTFISLDDNTSTLVDYEAVDDGEPFPNEIRLVSISFIFCLSNSGECSCFY